MNTRLSQADREKLRREVGLLTVPEAAGILGCHTIDIARQIAFGVIAHNTDASGQLLVSQADIHGYAAQNCPGLDSTPSVGTDGWLEGRPDGRTDRSEFIKSLKNDPRSYHSVRVGRYTLGQAFIGHEALAIGKIHANKLPSQAFERRSIAERFYSMGPVKFSAFKKSCRQQITQFSQVNLNGESVSLRALAGSSFARDIDQVLSEVF